MDSPDCLLLLLSMSVFLLFSFSVLHFLVVDSVRQIKLTHVGFRAHVKIASRIISYRTCQPFRYMRLLSDVYFACALIYITIRVSQ